MEGTFDEKKRFVAVFCTPQYLDRYKDQDMFALNVSVGIRNGEAADPLPAVDLLKLLFRPWTWNWSTERKMDGIQPSTMKLRVGTFTNPAAVTWSDANTIAVQNDDRKFFDALVKELDADFDRLVQENPGLNETAFQWLRRASNDKNRITSWPAALGQTSVYPYPIAHGLKLTYFFGLNSSLKPGDAMVVAPYISCDVAAPFTPSSNLLPLNNAPGQYAIPYDNEQLAVLTNTATVIARGDTFQAGENILESKRAWISIRDVRVGSNWLDELEDRLSDAFDVGQRLIDGLRFTLAAQPNPTILKEIYEQIPLLRKIILSTLFDTADFGFVVGPGGTCLAERTLRRAGANTDLWIKASKILSTREERILGELRGVDSGSNLNELREKWRQVAPLAASYAISRPQERRASGPTVEALQLELADLETLQSNIASDAILRTLLVIYWADPLKKAGPSKEEEAEIKLWQTISRAVPSLLEKEGLRRWMLLTNLRREGVLSRISDLGNTKQSDDRNRLRANIETEFLKTIMSYLQPLKAKAEAQNAYDAILRSLTAWVRDCKTKIIPSPHTQAKAGLAQSEKVAQPKRQTSADGITFQVDGLSARNADDEDDLARDSSGFCVLMREKKSDVATPAAAGATQGKGAAQPAPNPWRWLNIARARVRNSGIELSTPVIVPMPFTNQGDLRQAFVTYNNNPLAALSPAAEFGQRLYQTSAVDTCPKPIIEYLNGYGVTSRDGFETEALKLPGLVFGTDYEIAAFRVRNSSAVPQKLAEGENPAKFKKKPLIQLPMTGTVSYLRTASVGDLRAVAWDAKMNRETDSWPGVPERVYPRARDSFEIARFESLLRKDNDDKDSEDSRYLAEAPLMVLNHAAKNDEKLFRLYRPATDLHTWDRWVSQDPTLKLLRQNVWAEYHKRAVENSLHGNGVSGRSLLLEDPAVGTEVTVTLYVFDGTQDKRKHSNSLKWSPAILSNDKDLDGIVTAPLTLSILATSDVAGSFEPLLTDGSSQINVVLSKGQVAQLAITVNAMPGAEKRFDSNLQRSDRTAQFSMLLESSTDELPSESDISNAFEHFVDGSTVTARLNVTSDERGGPAKFRYLGRAEYLRQFWIWEGRAPNTPFPFGHFNANGTYNGGALDPSTLEVWEAEQFMSRTDNDYSVTAMLPSELSKPAAQRGARESSSVRIFHYVEDLSTDGRAMYIRSGVRVFSRYEGLNRTNVGVTKELPINTEKLKHRLFVPCRWTADVPKPHIKIIVPLTESAPTKEPGKASGLLVVVQGPWYEVGGLAEGLKAELVRVKDGNGSLQEAGPDGTLSKPVGTNNESYTISPLIGPIGHTFDKTDQTPMLTTTSFILPAPEIEIKGSPSNSTATPAWYLAKLRFARTLQRDVLKQSPYTDPVWVQFLPRFDFGDDTSTRVISPECSGGIVGKITVNPSLGNMPFRFSWLMVITSVIPDVSGRRDQLAFHGFMVPDGAAGSTWTPAPGNVIRCTDEDLLRAHLFELQTTPNFAGSLPNNFSDLCAMLFPKDGKEPKMRIARVSPPMGKNICAATGATK